MDEWRYNSRVICERKVFSSYKEFFYYTTITSSILNGIISSAIKAQQLQLFEND